MQKVRPESQTYRRLDDFTFSRNRITDYTGSASQLTLPAYYDTVTINSQDYTVEKDTGTQITSIGGDAFRGCTSLTSITLPSSLTSIGGEAFSGCSSLTEITLPSSLTSIGGDAFSGCTSLTSITIPEGVTSTGIGAFRNCSSLTEITLPSSLTSIGGSAFQNCSSLTEITIPEGVTSIGGYAFSGCTSLTSITIPQRVTSIGVDAFYVCTSLTEITIESDDVYKVATSATSAGYLLQYATTVKVLTSIVNENDNSYLENSSNFSTRPDGEYTVFTKVQG